MIALLKYGSGLPFNRLQDCLGIALPASTQWEIAAETAAQILPAWEELVRHAAAEEVLHNDCTPGSLPNWPNTRSNRTRDSER
jgi:transposase